VKAVERWIPVQSTYADVLLAGRSLEPDQRLILLAKAGVDASD
jgi:hypothetical protein